ncbi:hypothetical protein D3C71_1601780 [compost metagenome]
MGELVGGDVEIVQRGFEIVVAAAQLADQHLLVADHAHDRAAQEVGQQTGVAVDQTLEIVVVQFQHDAVLDRTRTGRALVIADQQAQLAEEFIGTE